MDAGASVSSLASREASRPAESSNRLVCVGERMSWAGCARRFWGVRRRSRLSFRWASIRSRRLLSACRSGAGAWCARPRFGNDSRLFTSSRVPGSKRVPCWNTLSIYASVPSARTVGFWSATQRLRSASSACWRGWRICWMRRFACRHACCAPVLTRTRPLTASRGRLCSYSPHISRARRSRHIRRACVGKSPMRSQCLWQPPLPTGALTSGSATHSRSGASAIVCWSFCRSIRLPVSASRRKSGAGRRARRNSGMNSGHPSYTMSLCAPTTRVRRRHTCSAT